MKYTYNGITFNDVDISSSYSNVGAKIKHHGIETISNLEDLSDYFIMDSVFINWNQAELMSTTDKSSYTHLYCTSDLLKYIQDLTNKVYTLEDKLSQYEDSKLYNISLSAPNLTYTFSDGLQTISKNTTEDNPKKIIFTPTNLSYFSVPTSVSVKNASYEYSYTTSKLTNDMLGMISIMNNLSEGTTTSEPITTVGTTTTTIGTTHGVTSGVTNSSSGTTPDTTTTTTSGTISDTTTTAKDTQYTEGAISSILSIWNPTDTVVITANAIPIQFSIDFTGITSNPNVTLNANGVSSITYLTSLSDAQEITVTSKNNYKIDNVTFTNCSVSTTTNTDTSKGYKLYKGVGNVTSSISIYRDFTVSGQTLSHCTLSTTTIKVPYQKESSEYTISLAPQSGYTLSLSDITVTGATKKSYASSQLIVTNVTGNISITATAQQIVTSQKYLFVGINRDESDYKPTETLFDKIIKNTYKVGSTSDDELIQTLSGIVYDNRVVEDYTTLDANKFYYHNVLIEVNSDSMTIENKLNVRYGVMDEYVGFVAIPKGYSIKVKNGLDIDVVETSVYGTFTYNSVSYNIYKLIGAATAFQRNIYLTKDE